MVGLGLQEAGAPWEGSVGAVVASWAEEPHQIPLHGAVWERGSGTPAVQEGAAA